MTCGCGHLSRKCFNMASLADISMFSRLLVQVVEGIFTVKPVPSSESESGSALARRRSDGEALRLAIERGSE